MWNILRTDASRSAPKFIYGSHLAGLHIFHSKWKADAELCVEDVEGDEDGAIQPERGRDPYLKLWPDRLSSVRRVSHMISFSAPPTSGFEI